MTTPERKAERKAIRRASKRMKNDADLDDVTRWAGRRAPDSRKAKLKAGIIARRRKAQ